MDSLGIGLLGELRTALRLPKLRQDEVDAALTETPLHELLPSFVSGQPASNCYRLSLEDMCLHDGRRASCNHGGLAGTHGLLVFHGTKNVQTFINILAENGVMRDATNIISGCEGWYHSEQFAICLGYARPTMVGNFSYRIVFEAHVRCANCCKRSNKRRNTKWQFTQSGCMRYSLLAAYFVPSDSVSSF
jgi:hypothetical protein